MSDNQEEVKIPKRVALYVRVSSADQVEMYGVRMQKKALMALIESKGTYENSNIPRMVYAGTQYYYEDDITGASNLNERISFSRLIHDLASSDEKPFDVLAVYKIDRIARSLKVLINALDIFKANGIELISANESIDTSTAFGRAILNIIGVIAELERETITQRTSDGKVVAVEDGVVMGSFATFGYRKDVKKKRQVFEEEAKYVRRIFIEYVHEGLSPEIIAQRLTQERVLSPRESAIHYGKMAADSNKKNEIYFWSPTAIRKILSDEVYLGYYYHNKSHTEKINGRKKQIRHEKSEWKISPERHTAIIGKRLFETAQKVTAERRGNRTKTQKKKDDYIYILRGLLECDHCKQPGSDRIKWAGSSKETPPKSGNYSYSYICGRKNKTKFSLACGCIPIPADQIEQYVQEFIQVLLEDPQLAYSYQMNLNSTKLHIQRLEERIDALQKNINAIPDMKNRLSEQHLSKVVSTEKMKEKAVEISRHEKECEIEMERLIDEKNQKEVPYHYIKVLEEYHKKYGSSLDTIFSDREKAQELVSKLISRIVIYSRPKRPDEKIAGRKKKGVEQYIPESIQIVLRLPDELLMHLTKGSAIDKQFGVRNDDL